MLKYSYDASGNMASQTLENVALPQITGQPVRQVVEPGNFATFSVVVSDASGVTFQWKSNGIDIPGATGDSLLLTNVSAANEGQYSVVVTNSAGNVTSDPAARLLDSDRDGLPDSWEIANFGNTTSQRSAGDPDGDGVTNSDEFYDGTNPNNSSSVRPRLVAHSDAGGSVSISPTKLSYDYRETVTLTATSIAPNVFVGWAGDLTTGDLLPTTNPVTLPLIASKTVRARFAAPAPIPPGLVAWWRAENDGQDVAGLNPGTVGAGVTFGAGKIGRAFAFDGGTVKVAASKSLDVGTGSGLTLEAWIIPADLAHPYPLFEWNDGASFGTHFWISSQGGPGCLVANIVDTAHGNHLFFSPGGLLSTTDWKHVALTYDRASGIGRLFLNGAQVATANLGNFTPLTTADLYLGHRPGNAFYLGLIDEPSVYDRALTLNEIFDLYSADLVGKDFLSLYFTSPTQFADVAPGASYSQALTTMLGAPPATFSLTQGALPPGMALSVTGVVSGVSNVSGIFDFTVEAKDVAGKTTEKVFVLRVLQPIPPPADLVAWWRGEAASGAVVQDMIGGHGGGFFSGQIKSTPSYTADGKVGGAFVFDGTVYVQIPDALELRPSEVTIEVWVFPTALSGDHQTIMARGSSVDDSDAWWLGVFAGKPRFWSNHLGAGSVVLEGPATIPLNQWTHLAATFDGTKRLYINGTQVASQAGLGALIYDAAAVPVTIGADWSRGAPNFPLKGRVDEASLYRRALSSDEIFSIADAGSSGKSTAGPYITSPSRLPFALVGQAYAQTFSSVGGSGQVAYSLSTDSVLPSGLTLTPGSVLSGTPAKTDRVSFRVRATDATGLFDEQRCALQVYESVAAPQGLIGWWRAEGDAQDSAGKNHGTQRNGASFAAGEVGQSFSLNGTGACIEIPDAPALRPASLTLEAWVLFDVTSGLRVVFAKPVGTGTGDSYALWLESGILKGEAGDAAGGPILSAPFSLAPGRFYHVAYTFDDAAKQHVLYVDGILVAIGAVVKSIGYDTQPLLLGRDTETGAPNFFLQGRIDEAAVYDRALSALEISSIFGAGPAGKRL